MIVKNLLVVGVMAGLASAAAAEESKANWKISGKIRMDAVQSTTETTAATAAATKTTAKSSSVALKRAQFSLVGTEGADTMELKYYLNTNDLNTATISHKWSDMITATFGHMGLLAQSWENDYSSTDQYVGSGAGSMAPGEADGAQVGLTFGDHSVTIQALQGLSSIAESDTENTTFGNGGALSSAVQYRGEINKMIRPLVTYTMVKTSSTMGTNSAGDKVNYGNGYQTQLGAGVQIETAGATVDLEYDSVTANKKKAATTGEDTTGFKDTNWTSIVLQAKYPVGASTPFFKYTNDKGLMGATSNVGDTSGSNIALGVEHNLDSHCRVHAVFVKSDSSKKADATLSAKTASTAFNLGVTASM